jgi:CubicO group peptidase (beta-lactamase class C family)
MKEWNVPGAAIAIVRNDSVIYAKGFGVRQLGRPEPVDANTIFGIGSNSKAFTAAGLEMLVDEGRVDLDAPVSTYIPDFRLSDPLASQEVSVRDLLTHRTGLARNELVWYGSGFTRDELVRRLRYLPSESGFRTRFRYNNVTYMAAGQVLAHATGEPWDDFVRARIFVPLGMTSTSTSIRDVVGRSNVVSPHVETPDGVRAIPWYNGDNVGPSGSINSNVIDMAQWLRLQLAGGTYAGKRIVSERGIEEMRSTQIALPRNRASGIMFPKAHLMAYGLGLMVSDYSGKLLVEHTGEIDGMASAIAMVPEARFGVVVLTNMGSGVMVPTALAHRIVDLALREPATDWSHRLRVTYDSLSAVERAAESAFIAQRVPNTRPTLPPGAYAGTYTDRAFGDLQVREKDGTLSFDFGPMRRGTLEHWHFDTFRSRPTNPALSTATLQFRLDPAGAVADVQVDFGGAGWATLKKVPGAAPGVVGQ